jgi:TRAP-type C4-dicarboxylate transport system permease small subunit
LNCALDLITNRIKTRQWLVFVLLTVGLILSLILLAYFGGEQQVNPEYFQRMFTLSMLGSVVFAVLLIVGAFYLRKWARR